MARGGATKAHPCEPIDGSGTSPSFEVQKESDFILARKCQKYVSMVWGWGLQAKISELSVLGLAQPDLDTFFAKRKGELAGGGLRQQAGIDKRPQRALETDKHIAPLHKDGLPSQGFLSSTPRSPPPAL